MSMLEEMGIKLKSLFGIKPYISIKELQKEPLSALFRRVKQDVIRTKSAGIEIYMDSWENLDGNRICSVCLGGAACLGIIKPPPTAARLREVSTLAEEDRGDGLLIAYFRKIFNSFRMGNSRTTAAYYLRFSDRETTENTPMLDYADDYDRFWSFNGAVSDSEYIRLLSEMDKFADHLEKGGY